MRKNLQNVLVKFAGLNITLIKTVYDRLVGCGGIYKVTYDYSYLDGEVCSAAKMLFTQQLHKFLIF